MRTQIWVLRTKVKTAMTTGICDSSVQWGQKKPWLHSSAIPGLMVTLEARIESPEAHWLYRLACKTTNNKEILCSQARRKSNPNKWNLLSSARTALAHMQPTFTYTNTHAHYTCIQGERKGNLERFKNERSRKSTLRCKHKQQIMNFLTGQ